MRKFYCDVLYGAITKAEEEKDFIRLGENFYIVFLYGDVPDESEFLRTARAMWLEIKSDNVEETKKEILDFGARKLVVPDPHLYFQALWGNARGWSGSTGISPSMLVWEKALMWQR